MLKLDETYEYERYICSECGGLVQLSHLMSNPPVKEYQCQNCWRKIWVHPKVTKVTIDMSGVEPPDLSKYGRKAGR